MKKVAIVILSLFVWLHTDGQVDQNVSPKGGLNQLAINYYGIDFTKEQRRQLKEVEVEFIFSIDSLGNPTLAEVNGVSDASILDSLKNKTQEIEPFLPKIKNGKAQSSIYFMTLVFPSYKLDRRTYGILQSYAYNEANLDDFEYLNESGERFDMVVGGLANQFLGKPSEHLAFGGGMKVDLAYTGKNKLIYGMNMSFYGNKLKKEYPLTTSRTQLSGPPTLLLGVVFGKWYKKFNIQGELNYAIQNVTERLGKNDQGWVQLRGWSPGVVINYPIRLGKPSTIYYYGAPSLFENNLNLHFGFRYLKLSLEEATGFMMELGIGYRMTMKGVKKYKLKDEFLNK